MKITIVDRAPRFEIVDGVEIILIGIGEKMMLSKIILKPNTILPNHNHPNEQIGICVNGSGTMISGGTSYHVHSGVSWTIPAYEEHSFESKGEIPVIIYEGWSPPREDYKKMAK